MRRPLRFLLALSLAVAPVAMPAAPAAASSGDSGQIETARTTRPVAPGMALTSIDTVDAAGWLRTDALSVDLGGGTTVDYLSPGAVAADDTVRHMAASATHKGTRPVAAINGDFFDINNSGAALGIGV